MKKAIYCVTSSKAKVSLPVSFVKTTKIKDVYEAKCPLIIFEDKFLKRRRNIDFSKMCDKICLVHFASEVEKDLDFINRFGCFDYFTSEETKKSIKFKLKRAESILRSRDRTGHLEEELVKNKRKIEEILLVDPVTHCYNWRYFFDRAIQEFSRARRHLYNLSFVGLDIDNFRQINEVYGVKAGDAVLKQFVESLKYSIRKEDIIIRWRSDEFFIIFPYFSQMDAYQSIRRIRKKIASKKFKYKNLKIALKFRIAIVSYPENNVFSPRDVANALEECLAKAKEKTGQQVVCYPESSDAVVRRERGSSSIDELKSKIDQLNNLLTRDVLEMIYGFAKAIEAKDSSTGKHVEYTSLIAREIASELNLPPSEVEKVEHAAILHDLGKVGIDESILCKKGPLTADERKIVNTHPLIATEILRGIHALRGAIPAILYHHERWDGKGYPMGLKGEEIPLNARIVAVADVYQALISDRPYRKAFSKKVAVEIIKQESGTHFDPKIVKVFLKVIKRIK